MLPTVSQLYRALAAALSLTLLSACVSSDRADSAASRRTATRARYTPEPFLPTAHSPQSPAPVPAATPRPAPLLSVDDTTRLQIFLDHENFGPGKLDGKPGEFTRKALVRYAHAHHLTLPPVGPALLAALPEAQRIQPFLDYTVTPEDLAQIGVMAEKVPDQGKQKTLPYTSELELLGERYHSERAFLARLNPGVNMDALAAGARVRVPAIVDPLYVTRLAQHGHLIARRPELQPRVVMVYTKEKMLDVLEDGQLLASFPITPGSTTLPAPPGTWKIVNMASMPYFRYDEAMLEHGVRSDNFVNLPPGPNSPVGVMWMGLNKSGIGLHGTANPETIGRAASHGCIRLANWDAVKLSQLVTVGTTVKIDGEGKPPAPAPAPTPALAAVKPVGETGEAPPVQ